MPFEWRIGECPNNFPQHHNIILSLAIRRPKPSLNLGEMTDSQFKRWMHALKEPISSSREQNRLASIYTRQFHHKHLQRANMFALHKGGIKEKGIWS
jgi:hypothetical protein